MPAWLLQAVLSMAPFFLISPLKKALASLTGTTAKKVGASLGSKIASTKLGGSVGKGLAQASKHVPEWAGKGQWNIPGAMGGLASGASELGMFGGAIGASDYMMNALFGGHNDSGQPTIPHAFQMPNMMALDQLQRDADLRKALTDMGIDLDNDQVQQIMRIL